MMWYEILLVVFIGGMPLGLFFLMMKVIFSDKDDCYCGGKHTKRYYHVGRVTFYR